MTNVTIRPATHDDYEGVVAFTRETFDGADYMPDVYHEWIRGTDRRTLVADAGEEIAGIVQMVMLSESEAWGQGMRVNPAYREQGVATALNQHLFEWAREQGATVARVLIFSWNQAAIAQARATGYEPVSEFRWLKPDLDSPMAGTDSRQPANTTGTDLDATWTYWRDSDAKKSLGGLGLSLDESWAIQEVTPDLLARAAEDTAVLTIEKNDGVEAMSYRTRTFDWQSPDGDTKTYAEYGVAAWDQLAAGRSLRDAILTDATRLGADRIRVLLPETPRHIADSAQMRANIATETAYGPPSDYPGLVMAADLTSS